MGICRRLWSGHQHQEFSDLFCDRPLAVAEQYTVLGREAGVLNANLLEAYVQLYPGKRIDIGVVFEAAGISFMERKNVTTANINELRAFINAAGQISGGSYHGALTQVKVFYSTINVPFEARSVIVIGDSATEAELGAVPL